MTDVPNTPVKNSFMFNKKNEDSAAPKRNQTLYNHRRELSQNVTPMAQKQASILITKTPGQSKMRFNNNTLNNSTIVTQAEKNQAAQAEGGASNVANNNKTLQSVMNSIMNNSTLISNGGGSVTYYGGAGGFFDLDREKDKLHKYLRIKERSVQQREQYGQRMQQLWSNKELKFRKIEEKLRKDIKEKTKKWHQQEIAREQKRQLIVDKLTEREENAD